MEGLLDAVDHMLLDVVQADARLSFREIGRRIGMSTPAVADRIRRLEAAGVIMGYAARVDRAALGQEIGAFIRLTVSDRDFQRVSGLCRSLDAVVACHHITGEESFVIRVAVSSIAELEDVISRFRKIGPAQSSVILSSPVDGKPARTDSALLAPATAR
ncbi:MAG: Lrp/AsnC family transcriptional regulator [Alphaproteobacteria bacterium]